MGGGKTADTYNNANVIVAENGILKRKISFLPADSRYICYAEG